ncbi:MAG: AAA family ATPase, partial [Lachnospiraceae bacterium]|nr:AAA family ATPase [Lachnospiraceae bacterium]
MATYYKLHIKKAIDSNLRDYPSILLAGARQVGKTSIFENEYKYKMITLDNLNTLESIKNDAVGVISSYDKPLVIDEVQKEQSVFNALKYLIDKEKINGNYLLTGSQKFELMKNISESLSGRIGILQLLGLSNRELNDEDFYDVFIPTKEYLLNRKPKNNFNQKKIWENIQRGSFPKLYDEKDFDFERFYSNYIDTYVERDVRNILNVTNLYSFT